MFDRRYDNAFTASWGALDGARVTPEIASKMREAVVEKCPEGIESIHLKAMMERYTLGTMLRYFRDSKEKGAEKLDTHAMAYALNRGGFLLEKTEELTSILGSFRRPKPSERSLG